MTIVLIALIILIILIILILNKQENLEVTPVSAEAVAHIASVYADRTNTTTMNNLIVTGTVNAPLVYNSALQPQILTITIGSYKGPIFDISGNTFPTSKYTIKQISGSNTIGVRNNKWWICTFPNWGEWQMSTLEIIPIPLNSYYSSFVSHPCILTDSGMRKENTKLGCQGPVNSDNESYIVYNSAGIETTINTPATSF